MMNDGSINNESPRNPGWEPRVERIQAQQDATSISNLFLQNSRERAISRVIQVEGHVLQALGAGLVGYSSIISSDLRTVVAGALLVSAGRIVKNYFK